MEENFECSGVGTIPKFYVTRSHLVGPPTQSCGDAVGEEFGEFLTIVGVIMVINSFFNFLVFNVQYGYWCKKSEQQVKKEEAEKAKELEE